MSLLWKPNGSLDIASAATDLPETPVGRNSSISGAFTRAKNLRLVRDGIAKTRFGSTRLVSTNRTVSRIITQSSKIYTFGNGTILEDTTSLATGVATSDWDAFRYNAFNDTTEQIFALNGTDRKRITSGAVNEWGIAAPSSAPSVSAGDGTGLTGTYSFKITYARLVSSTVVAESNPSDASSEVTVTDKDIDLTWTDSSDSQVTHVRVYRTIAGGSTYFHDQDVATGTEAATSSQADSALGSEVATNHDRPPLGTLVAGPFYGGICFIVKDNLLYYSLSKQPEHWPSTNFVEVGPPQLPIQAFVSFLGQPYVLSKERIWFVQGTSGDVFNPLPMQSMTGAQGRFGAIGVEGHGIYHTGPDGIYLFASGKDRKVSESRFDPLFYGESVGGIPAVSDMSAAWLRQFGNLLLFHYGSGSVLVFYLDSNRTAYYEYDKRLDAPFNDARNGRFLASDSDGAVRKIEDSSSTDDAGAGIDWEAQSKDFTLQTRRHFPRWAKWDVDASSASGVTGSILLDGTVHQQHSLTGNRDTTRRLIKTGNGRRCAMRLTGTGSASFFAAEME